MRNKILLFGLVASAALVANGLGWINFPTPVPAPIPVPVDPTPTPEPTPAPVVDEDACLVGEKFPSFPEGALASSAQAVHDVFVNSPTLVRADCLLYARAYRDWASCIENDSDIVSNERCSVVHKRCVQSLVAKDPALASRNVGLAKAIMTTMAVSQGEDLSAIPKKNWTAADRLKMADAFRAISAAARKAYDDTKPKKEKSIVVGREDRLAEATDYLMRYREEFLTPRRSALDCVK